MMELGAILTGLGGLVAYVWLCARADARTERGGR